MTPFISGRALYEAVQRDLVRLHSLADAQRFHSALQGQVLFQRTQPDAQGGCPLYVLAEIIALVGQVEARVMVAAYEEPVKGLDLSRHSFCSHLLVVGVN